MNLEKGQVWVSGDSKFLVLRWEPPVMKYMWLEGRGGLSGAVFDYRFTMETTLDVELREFGWRLEE